MPAPIYERLPNESDLAYRAFVTYRDLGPARTMDAVRIKFSKSRGYLRQLLKWSGKFRWVERATAWDDYLQAERDEVARAEARKWEERRQRAFQEAYDDAQLLKSKARDILKLPLVRKETEEHDAQGNVRKVILKPVGFRHKDAAGIMGVAGQMEQFAIKGALPVVTGTEGEDGEDDPLTAEEAALLRKVLREHRAQAQAQVQAQRRADDVDARDDAGGSPGDA